MERFLCSQCVVDMALPEFLLWLAVLIGGTLYLLYLCFKNFNKARLIEDMPTSLIRSASQGFTELIGVARIYNEPLLSPLSNTHCLWWQYRIERYQRRGKSSSWVTIESGASEKPFYIDDNSGLCLVLPDGADLSARHKRRWRGRRRHPLGNAHGAPAKTGGFIDMVTTDIGFGRRYRYTETMIKEGDPLYVLGHFESDASGQRTMSVQKLAGEILRSWKPDFGNLLEQYDKDGDGQLDIPEWKVVEQSARKAAHLKQRDISDQAPEHQIGKPAEKGLPFLVGSEEQHHLSRRYRFIALACGAGFIALGAYATWYINARGF